LTYPAQEFVDFVRARQGKAGELVEAMGSGRISTSVSHNDAKIGNVLLKAGPPAARERTALL
jgi:hypothetical protein